MPLTKYFVSILALISAVPKAAPSFAPASLNGVDRLPVHVVDRQLGRELTFLAELDPKDIVFRLTDKVIEHEIGREIAGHISQIDNSRCACGRGGGNF
jgi:hypothetical protein